MGTSVKEISQAPEGMSRPSLLSTGAPGADHNILDAMHGQGDRAQAGTRQRRLWWLVIPLLAASAWGISTQLTHSPAVRPTQATVVAAAKPAPQTTAPTAAIAAPELASTTSATTTSTTGSTSDPFQSLAAAPAAASVLPAANTATNPVISLQAEIDAPAATPSPAKAVLPATEAPTATAAKKTTTKTTAKAAEPSSGKSATSTARKAPSTEGKTAAQAKTPPQKQAKAPAAASVKAGKRDPDVELLSAIMQHLNEGKGSAAATTAARSPQSIAELVKSCRTKDSIEALICQRRICEGSWGKAQACPKEKAPKSAKAVSPT